MQILWILLQQGDYSEWWTELTRSSAKGHIGRVKFFCPQPLEYALARPKMKYVKAVWEISEEVSIRKNMWTTIGGGRGKDPKITWEEAYETLLRAIC